MNPFEHVKLHGSVSRHCGVASSGYSQSSITEYALNFTVEKTQPVSTSLIRPMKKKLTKSRNACATASEPASATAAIADASVVMNVGMSEMHRQAASGGHK